MKPFHRNTSTGDTYYGECWIGHVLADVDGYYKWWPQGSGYLDEAFLRWMADFLRDLNREWDAIVRQDLGGPNAPKAG